MGIADSVREIIYNPIAFSFSVIIIFSALFGYLKPSRRLQSIKKRLEEAINLLPKQDHRNEFVKNYRNIIDESFSRDDSTFSYLWKEFKEQLIKPSQEVNVFQNSIRPKEFFTLNHILEQHKINLRWLNSLPGVLVGLGVLGTFVGLTWSLISVVPDLSAGDQENLNNAVKTLIKGSGIAFVTSIVGLFSSLVFNFLSDHRMSKIQGLVDEFNSDLEKSLKFTTEEHLLTLHLKEISQQGEYLKNMDERIALKIGDMTQQIGTEIKNVISKSNQNISESFFTDIANKMANSMEGFSKQQAENLNKNLSMLQDTIPALLDRLNSSQKQNEQATSDAISNLASVNTENQKNLDQKNKEFYLHLEKSQKQNEENVKAMMHNMFSAHQSSQKQINESIVGATQNMNESISNTIKNMKGDFENITSNLKQGMSEAISSSSETLKKLLDVSVQINSSILKQTKDIQISYQKHSDQFINNLNEAITEVKDITSHIRMSVEGFHQASDQQTQIVEKNKHFVNSLDALSEQLKNMSTSVSDVLQKTPQFIAQIEESNQSLRDTWSKYESRFQDIDESASHLFEKISEGLQSVSNQSAKHIGDLSQQSTQVANHFAQAVGQLQEAIDEMNDNKNKPELKEVS